MAHRESSPSVVLDAALAALDAGISLLPVANDGTKSPALPEWKRLEAHRPTPEEVSRWYERDYPDAGLGLIGGPVSGGLEFIDIDEQALAQALGKRAAETGLRELLERIGRGWRELTPNGAHLAYRCSETSGNRKLARRPKRTEEMEHPNDKIKVLIETRGAGGYAITWPSGGRVHPSGRAYGPMHGQFDTIATITPEEREALWALCASFDEMPRTEYSAPRTDKTATAAGDRPGDDFNARADWAADVLEPHGWRMLWSRGELTYWRRPGRSFGWSATTGERGEKDLLWVFSTSTIFDAERGYSKFAAYALLNHNGDFSAAARDLGARGFGHLGSTDRTDRTTKMRGSTDGFVSSVSDSQEENWPEPDDLAGPPPAPLLPIDLLPTSVANVAIDAAERMQAPVDYVVWSGLVAAASLIGRGAGLRPRAYDDWVERAALWIALIGDVSSLKTPAAEQGLRPLRRQAAVDQQQYAQASEAWQRERDQAKADKRDAPAPPVPNRCLTTDITIEKVATLLQADNRRLLTIYRDELSGLILGMNRYHNGGGGDREFYLQGYSGGVYFVDRVTRPSEFVPDLLFNVLGGVQPEKASEVLASGADDGLGARFACIWPELTTWRLVDRKPNKIARDALDKVHDRLAAADWSQDLLRDEFTPTPFCRLDHDAQALFDAWYAAFMADLRSHHYSGRLLGRLGKYPGFVSRLLLVCWLLEWAQRGDAAAQRVPGDVANNVIRLVTTYCCPMDKRVYAAFSTGPESLAGRRIARWIAEEQIQQFTPRDVYRHCWSECPTLVEVQPALEWLAAHRWIREADRQARPGRPSNVYLVNPRHTQRHSEEEPL